MTGSLLFLDDDPKVGDRFHQVRAPPQNNLVRLIGMKSINLPVCFEQDLIPGGDHLGIQHIRPWATQAGVRPFDSFDLKQEDLACIDIWPSEPIVLLPEE